MKITAIAVRDFKRIRDVKLAPDADRALLAIGGKNAQGKSSLLDSLTAAFGGKRALPPEPVRRGAKDAEIKIELDNGLVVLRTIDAAGDTVLEVRDADGAVRSPQAVLDKLVGGRFLDPLAFLALPAKDQREALLKLIDQDRRIAELDAKRERASTRRTEIGRDLKKAEGELARLPEVTPGQEIDIRALSAQASELGEVMRRADQAKDRQVRASNQRDVAAAEVASAKAKLAEAERKLTGWEDELAKAQADLETAATGALSAVVQRRAIEEQLEKAQAHNRAVSMDQAAATRRAAVASDLLAYRTEHAKAENAIAEIDRRKAEALAAAQLPVPGLGVDDGAVTLNGVPLNQASQAERYRVAVALQIAAAPNLADIWVHDGSLLDDDSLALLAEVAQAAGVRLWVERVGDRDPGAIVIHDGTVRAAAEGAAA